MYKNIIYCTLVLCFVQAISHTIPDSLIDEKTAECMKELELDLKALSKMNDENLLMIEKNEDTLRFLECQLGKRKFFDSNGNFNKENTVNELVKGIPKFIKNEVEDKKALALAIFESCTNSNSERLAEKLFDFHNCAINVTLKNAPNLLSSISS